jgi:transcriptional regulator with XRE-family HTH domain
VSTIDPKHERLNRGLTIAALAARTEVPEYAIGRLERGNRIDPERAKRIADHFGVQVTDFPAFAPTTSPAASAA